ncbi:hypothetical protein LR48_Vigan05g115700 [Vigna angularis]|uniref:Aminotransferase-like plant mobile domain-containing protein n=1 Tax=Phaseolus angularis TaxID=3914 RepID=A0A0L9ULX9_PHAAN|nr:hypothetical protein LR48_Vigan05g115700 [Vigna angularis]
MGRRELVSSYDDTTPRAARWQSPRQSSNLAKIRSQLDDLTYSGVVWHPYEGHQGIRSFFNIYMYSGWIRIGDTLSRHLPERVIRQFGLYQEIPRPPTVVADADVVTVDYPWRVSHPYIIPAPPDTGPALGPTQLPDVPQEAQPHCRSSPPSPFGVVARFRRMTRMLQSLISCRHVTEGTIAHQVLVDLLQIANEGIDEYSPTRKGQRHVRGRRSASN